EFGPYSIRGAALCGPPASQDDIACAPGEVIDSFVLGGDGPPALSDVPGNVSVAIGQPVAFVVKASDPDGDPIDALVADLPRLSTGGEPAFVPDPARRTGRFSWTPTAADIGTHAFRFRAANALACTATTFVDVKAFLGVTPGVPAVLALLGVRP